MKKTAEKLENFIKKEIVLCLSAFLALISMFFIKPDASYLSYIDFRTLAILFCLMTIVAGFRQLGIFDLLAVRLLQKGKGIYGVMAILMLLCFFMSMLITNDVALITFVPLTITLFDRAGSAVPSALSKRLMLTCIAMQTIAANLGSMLTPIGNPQNLFLYGKANTGGHTMTVSAFVGLLFPYSLLSLILLMLWILLLRFVNRKKLSSLCPELSLPAAGYNGKAKEYLIAYLLLFGISLLCVAHLLPYGVPFFLVLLYTLLRNRRLLMQVDYSLLFTFATLFIFIGNLGRIPQFYSVLQRLLSGREVLTAVLASQVMSNVPAAVLLEKFSSDLPALMIGTNLGGLGSLIASMASLISFKYIAGKDSTLCRRYLAEFTLANLMFLAVLLLFYFYHS